MNNLIADTARRCNHRVSRIGNSATRRQIIEEEIKKVVNEVNEVESLAIMARDLTWSKALGFMSTDFGKESTPEFAARFMKEAKQMTENNALEKAAEEVERNCFCGAPTSNEGHSVAGLIRALKSEIK